MVRGDKDAIYDKLMKQFYLLQDKQEILDKKKSTI